MSLTEKVAELEKQFEQHLKNKDLLAAISLLEQEMPFYEETVKNFIPGIATNSDEAIPSQISDTMGWNDLAFQPQKWMRFYAKE